MYLFSFYAYSGWEVLRGTSNVNIIEFLLVAFVLWGVVNPLEDVQIFNKYFRDD